MILKITDRKGGLYYANQIHRCYVETFRDLTTQQIIEQNVQQSSPRIPHEAKVLDEKAAKPTRLIKYFTFADALISEHRILFNVDAYLMDETGTTIEKL